MKQIKDLERELDEILDYDTDLLKPVVKTSVSDEARIAFLNTCISYLKTEPTEEFVKKEVNRLQEKIAAINIYAPVWATDRVFDSEEKRLSAYMTEQGVPKLKAQLRTLNFLLG